MLNSGSKRKKIRMVAVARSVTVILMVSALAIFAGCSSPLASTTKRQAASSTTSTARATSTPTRLSLPGGAVYPAPISEGMGDARSGCPSLSGVEASRQPSFRQLAVAIFDLGGSRTEALKASDPAFWPMILTKRYGTYYGRGSPPVTELAPRLLVVRASQSSYEALIAHCGSKTVASSWIAQVCHVSSGQTAAQGCAADPALAGKVVFIDRLGHWLITYVYT